MSDAPLPTKIAPSNRLLTSAEFHHLAAVPPEVEWFANIRNKSTRRAYENAIQDFMDFTGIGRPEEFRAVTRAYVIAWRDDLARRELGGATVRHRLAALSSLFEYLCEKNAVTHNPVKGVKRPRSESGEGKTPALGDHQARELLAAPCEDTLKDKRDRAILSTLLYHALRRAELCSLKVRDFRHTRRGVPHLRGGEDLSPPGRHRVDFVEVLDPFEMESSAPVRARRPAICPSIRAPTPSSTTTSRLRDMAPMRTGPCFGRSKTTARARSRAR